MMNYFMKHMITLNKPVSISISYVLYFIIFFFSFFFICKINILIRLVNINMMLRNKKKKKLGHGNWEETFYVTCNDSKNFPST